MFVPVDDDYTDHVTYPDRIRLMVYHYEGGAWVMKKAFKRSDIFI